MIQKHKRFTNNSQPNHTAKLITEGALLVDGMHRDTEPPEYIQQCLNCPLSECAGASSPKCPLPCAKRKTRYIKRGDRYGQS